MASWVLPNPSYVIKPNNPSQPHCSPRSSDLISLRFGYNAKPKLRFSAKATSNDSSRTTATSASKSKVEKRDVKQANEPSRVLLSEESTTEFMAQVSSLIKLVDSRDVVELQLKQYDCELVIRKKEALPLPAPRNNVVMMPSPPQPAVAPPPKSAPTPSPASSSAQAPAPSPPPGKPKSSQAPLKCPMAGTFYRCPAPGEPPFVKVGDKVQKGQIVCIIEAMKLMNEIEADRSGTVVEVLMEDGKPVSMDTPLFIVEP